TVAYSGQAKLAATCGFGQLIWLWNLDTGEPVRALTGDRNGTEQGVCFSPDGKRLATVNLADNTVRIWDVATGEERKRIITGHPFCVAFSPDGKRLVSGGYSDGVVRVWDAATGKQLR